MRNLRNVCIAAAGLIALTFAMPPYCHVSGLANCSFGGYAWLWQIPELRAAVAWPLLLVEWIGLAIIGGLLWMAFKERNE